MATNRLSIEAKQCGVCDEGTVSHRCLDCDEDMCQKCMKMHLRYKLTSTHSFMDIVKTQIQVILEQTNGLRNRVRDRIESFAQNEEKVTKNVTATKQEITDFALEVTKKCEVLLGDVDEMGEAILVELRQKRKELMEQNEVMGTQIDQLSRVINEDKVDASLTKVVKKFEADNAVIEVSLSKSKPNSVDKVVFSNPLQLVDKMRVSIQTETDRGDSGAYVDPPLDQSTDEPKSPTVIAKVTPSVSSQEKEAPPKVLKRESKASVNRRVVSPPVSMIERQESYEDMGPDFDEALHICQMNRDIDFEQFLGPPLKHMEDHTIETDYSSTFQMINNEIWLVSGRSISVFGKDSQLIREMYVKTIGGAKKQANFIHACAQNSRANVFVALTRDRALDWRKFISGLWMIHPMEGHALAKISEGGYINVVADGEKIVGLREDKCKVTIHAPTGSGLKDWVEVESVNIYGEYPSILALDNTIYATDGNKMCITGPGGDKPKIIALPRIQLEGGPETANWNLCCIDPSGSIIVCEQISGHVYLYQNGNGFQRIQFGKVGSDLEEPTQVLPDSEGHLWVHEQTIYGTLLSCFTRP